MSKSASSSDRGGDGHMRKKGHSSEHVQLVRSAAAPMYPSKKEARRSNGDGNHAELLNGGEATNRSDGRKPKVVSEHDIRLKKVIKKVLASAEMQERFRLQERDEAFRKAAFAKVQKMARTQNAVQTVKP